MCLTTEEVGVFTTPSVVKQNDSLSSGYLIAKKHFRSKNYTHALRISLELLQSNNSLTPSELILINQLIADIYFESRNSINAIKYYKKTLHYLTIFKRGQLDLNLPISSNFNQHTNLIKAKTLIGIGTSYYRLEDTNILNTPLDSALYYYQKITNIKDLNREVMEVKSRAYTNMSGIYMNHNRYEKAKEFANKAIDIHKRQNNKVNQAAALGNLSSIFVLEKNYNKAKDIYFEALDLIRNIKTVKSMRVKEDLYFNLAFNLYKLKDYKSYDFQSLSYRLKDSLREKEFREIITQINMKFDFDVKKKSLIREEERKRFRVAVGSLLIIFSLLGGLYYYKLRQKNLGLQLIQTKLIQDQHIEKIKSESQVRILNATIDGKESERKQIAETLHDSVSTLLSSANLHLRATQTKFHQNTPEEIDKTQKIIMEAAQVIRSLSHTLVSSVLLKFGLEYAIKDMANKYSNSQIEIETNLGVIGRYQQNFEIKTYNIIQEFLNNILKHSKAEKALINLEEVKGELRLKISDDGIGFDKTKIKNKEGIGLNQIEARIQMMKGDFDVISSMNKGTIITVRLPILKKKPVR
jgi:signal transduction histidine kinase